MFQHEAEFGYVLHRLTGGDDVSTVTEAEALELTRSFSPDEDWSL